MEEHKKFGATDFLMLLAVLVWAVNFSIIKIALREFSPQGFNGIRLFFASSVLVLVLSLTKEGLSIPRSLFWKIILIGIVGNTIYQLLFIHGLNWSTASNTSVIMAMTPVFIAMLSNFLKHERIHWAGWLGIFISFIGFYFVITRQASIFHFSWETVRGDLMIFMGNICWSFYTVLSKPLLDKISPLKLTSLTMATGTLFYLPFAAREVVRLHWNEVSFKAWAGLLFSGLFALSICCVIWYASVKRVGNSRTGVYSNITPVFAVLFASVFLSERITPLQIGGALVIFTGVYLTRFGYRHFD